MLPPCGSTWTIMLHNSGIIDLIAVSGSANIHVQAILDTREPRTHKEFITAAAAAIRRLFSEPSQFFMEIST